MREKLICELKRLALQRGPEQYLAFDELARRLRGDRPNWWTPEEDWSWNPFDMTRAPSAIEVEWAFLELSKTYNGDAGDRSADYELIEAQDRRLDEIEKQLDPSEESLAMRYFNRLQECVRKSQTD